MELKLIDRIEALHYGPEQCTCDTPCCIVDVGVAYVTCGEQHCFVHGTLENQGVPSYRSYGEGSLYGVDTVKGEAINDSPHDGKPMDNELF